MKNHDQKRARQIHQKSVRIYPGEPNIRCPSNFSSTKENPVELIHMKFLKQLLGVQGQTQNIGILLETGRVPLMTFAAKNCVKNWERIAIQKKCNPFVYESYINIVENEFPWYKNISLYMNLIGLGSMIQGKEPLKCKVVVQRTSDIFHQDAFSEIGTNKSKLRTYNLFKKEIGEEPYLKSVSNVKDRISLTKFRLSNHKLMIEKGRHLKLEKSKRTCPFCNSIENEIHFLLHCTNFTPIREKLFNDLRKFKNLKIMDVQNAFIYLLKEETIAPIVGKYITKSMELRDFLFQKPKQNL